MPVDDDQDWMDALAGRPRSDADPRTLREAATLRAVLLEQVATVGPDSDEEHRRRLERLLFRLRRQGLLQAPRWSGQAWRRPLAAAAVLALGLAVVQVTEWRTGPTEEPAVVRGVGGVQRIEVDDAAQAAAAIATALRAEGIEVREYPLGVALGLDATVAPAQRARAQAILAPYGIALAEDGRLTIEVTNRPK